MKRFILLISGLLALPLFAASNKDISTYFNGLSHAEKYMFLKSMPKSGELHTHLAGSVYPETLINLAPNYCIQPNLSALPQHQHCEFYQLKDLYKHRVLYEKTLKAWSMKDFDFSKGSGHDHFFNTFQKFNNFFELQQPTFIVDTAKRAIAQNETYLELMISPEQTLPTHYGKLINLNDDIHTNYQRLIHDASFKKHIHHTVHHLYDIDKKAKEALGCANRECPIEIKYQFQILREFPTKTIIAQAITAFEATSHSTKLVGINMVQPEDGYQTLTHYKEQMALIDFLHKLYPSVNISLHAGELNNRTVSTNDLSFHIHDALMTGHAERIGHGTAIAFENNAIETLAYMKKNDIPVEVNLTSNENILNASPKTHPLRLYLHNDVPVVLSTDDEGILRTTLTDEYLKAIEQYGVSYKTLKQINRNGLSYAFLNGQSIWADNNHAIPRPVCKKALNQMTLDTACKAFIQESPKARLQWRLEKRLADFEKKMLKLRRAPIPGLIS